MNVKDRPWTISRVVLWDRASYDERVDLLARFVAVIGGGQSRH
jgi:hypothetical protein